MQFFNWWVWYATSTASWISIIKQPPAIGTLAYCLMHLLTVGTIGDLTTCSSSAMPATLYLFNNSKMIRWPTKPIIFVKNAWHFKFLPVVCQLYCTACCVCPRYILSLYCRTAVMAFWMWTRCMFVMRQRNLRFLKPLHIINMNFSPQCTWLYSWYSIAYNM